MKEKNRKISVLSLQCQNNKQGWLKKQGGKHKNWKTRFFILNDNILYYFKTAKDKIPKGIIPLNAECRIEFVNEGAVPVSASANEEEKNATTVAPSSKPTAATTANYTPTEKKRQMTPDKWSLKIYAPWRVYWFCSDVLNDISSWVSALTIATKMSVKRRHENSLKEGWIAKQGKTFKSWKMRYMILKSDAMYYYEFPDSSIAKGSIALLNATVTHNDPTKTIKSPKMSHMTREESQALINQTTNTDTSTNTSTENSDIYSISTTEISSSDYQSNEILEYGFKITNDIRTYLIYALNQSECDKWMMRIQRAILETMTRLATSRVVGETQVENELLLRQLNPELSQLDDEIISDLMMSLSSIDCMDSCRTDSVLDHESNGLTSQLEDMHTDDSSTERRPSVNSPILTPRKLEEFSYLIAHFVLKEIQARSTDEKELLEYLKDNRKRSHMSLALETANIVATRDRSRSLIVESAMTIFQDQKIDPNMIPIKLCLKPGIYQEESLKFDRPIEIEGSGVDNTIIVLFKSTRRNNMPLVSVAAQNVRLKNLTLKIYANDLEEEILSASPSKLAQQRRASLFETYKSIVYVSSGSCYLENCRLSCEPKQQTSDAMLQKTCAVLVTNDARCYLEGCDVQSDYGMVVTQMGFVCADGGVVRAKLNPVKKLSSKPGSDVRMYGTRISTR